MNNRMGTRDRTERRRTAACMPSEGSHIYPSETTAAEPWRRPPTYYEKRG